MPGMPEPRAAIVVPRPPASYVFVTAVAALGWIAHATAFAADPRTTLSTLLSGLAVFAFLPAVMAAAMATVAAVACLLLTPLALVGQVATGRPSGLRDLAAALFAPGLAVVPGYVAALGRCRSPLAWGFVSGSTIATAFLAVWLATRTAI